MTKRSLSRFAVFIGASCAGLGTACAAEDYQARVWAAACGPCHGTNGASRGGIPGLAGKAKADLLKALLDLRSGAQVSTVMQQHAKGYSDAELERLADYFSRQKP